MATEQPIVAGVAGRYAAALFDLAGEQGQVAEVEQDLIKLHDALDVSTDLQRLVRSPVIAADDQARAMSAVLSMLGVSALTQNFLKLVTKNRRLFALADVIRAYRALAARARGEVTANIATAHSLSDAQAEELKAALRATVGKDVTLRTTVDPSLIGGLIVRLAAEWWIHRSAPSFRASRFRSREGFDARA